MSVDRTSHDYIQKLIGESTLRRKVEHHEFEGKEGAIFHVQVDPEHSVEAKLDHFENVDSDYVDGFSVFFNVDAADDFPSGIYKIEPADGGEAMALTLSPVSALTQGEVQYQATVGHLKEEADASIDDAPTPDAD